LRPVNTKAAASLCTYPSPVSTLRARHTHMSYNAVAGALLWVIDPGGTKLKGEACQGARPDHWQSRTVYLCVFRCTQHELQGDGIASFLCPTLTPMALFTIMA